MVVDHINGNTLDNRKENLRRCSNGANIRKGRVRTTNNTGCSGVTKRLDRKRNPWAARIKVNYKQMTLGHFRTYEEAVFVRKEAERKYWNI